jgi:hypothetical protein
MDNQLPSADEQIIARLQNAVRGVLLELESQGAALGDVSGGYTVTITAGEISVSKPPVDSARAGKIKPAAVEPSTTE